MQLVPKARTLDEHLIRCKLSLRDKLSLFDEICEGVEEAHKQHIVHRDLKPRNVLISVDASRPAGGSPKIIDFGLAVEQADLFADGAQRPSAGQFIGTVKYASPEQCKSLAADKRSDVYSLGVMLFEMVTGKMPYESGEISWERAASIYKDAVPADPQRLAPELAWDVAAVLRKSVELDPAKRYQSVAAMRADIRKLLGGGRPAAVGGWRSLCWPLGAMARTRPAMCALVIPALASLIVYGLANLALSAFYPVAADVNAAFTSLVAPSPGPGFLKDVRTVELTDDDDLDALAELVGYEVLDVPGQHRPVTAEIIRRLSRGGARVVTSDFVWNNETPTNLALRDAITQLRADGGEMVVVSGQQRGSGAGWATDPQTGRPDVAPPIFDAAERWGGQTVAGHADGVALIDLCIMRDEGVVLPSLSLASYAAHRQPGMYPRYEATPSAARIVYERKGANGVRIPVEGVEPDLIRVDHWMPIVDPDEFEQAISLRDGDMVAAYLTLIPDDDTFDAAAASFADVLQMNDVELRRTYAGKSVVVLNHRSDSPDKLEVEAGRLVSGGRIHAAAIQSLVLGLRPRFPAETLSVMTMAAAAVFGGMVGIALRRSLLGAVVAMLGMWGLLVAIGVLWYRFNQVIWNPLLPIAAATLALGLGFWIWRKRPGLEPVRGLVAPEG